MPGPRLGPLLRSVLPFVAAQLAASAVASAAAADPVLEWNAALCAYAEARSMGDFPPPPEMRAGAITHRAMLQAVVEAEAAGGDARAAVARAAHDSAVALLPRGAADFGALLARQLAAIPPAPAKSAGEAIGARAAAAVLRERADDGYAQAEGPYTEGEGPGRYRMTAPGYAHYNRLGRARPFALEKPAQFRAPPPYAVTDPDYVADLNEVRALGGAVGSARTADETALARFWCERSGAGWNRIARILAARRPGELRDHARLFAALNAALADAIVASFDSKYTYHFWRPVTALHLAATDGNKLTAPAPDWEPHLPTPPMPDYPSAHAATGGAAAVVLAWHFGGDEQDFEFRSAMEKTFPDLGPRRFQRLSDAALESALSRLYAGIHFRRACLAGLEQGRQVGTWVIAQPAFAP